MTEPTEEQKLAVARAIEAWRQQPWKDTHNTPHPDLPRFLPTATDLRRAAATLLYADPLLVDGNGLRSIADEVDADGRGVQLAAIAKGSPAEARGPNPQCFSKNHIEGELRNAGYGDHTDHGHTQKAIREALAQAVQAGIVRSIPGPRRAQLHCIAYPCSECGMPVTSQRERHESCPSGPEELFE